MHLSLFTTLLDTNLKMGVEKILLVGCVKNVTYPLIILAIFTLVLPEFSLVHQLDSVNYLAVLATVITVALFLRK